MGGGGSCCDGIGRSMGGRSIQSASSSSILDVVDVAIFVFVGRESAERDRNASLLRIDEDESG
jgi:hypothetical protein